MNINKFILQMVDAREKFMARRKHCLELGVHSQELMSTFAAELYEAGVVETIHQTGPTLTIHRGKSSVRLLGLWNKASSETRLRTLQTLSKSVLEGHLAVAVLVLFSRHGLETVSIYRRGNYLVYLPSRFDLPGFPGIEWL